MKRSIFITACSIAILSFLLLVKADSVKGEPPPPDLKQAQSKVTRDKGKVAKDGDPELQNDKEERFKMMEWLIRQNLMKQYEQIEVSDDLEDDLN
jgi:hypothetical protein